MNMNLSTHFTLAEATFSSTAVRLGIDNNSPPPFVITNAIAQAVMMEKVRNILGYPIHIDSWIRCLALNAALKSKTTSQHLTGEATDFICSPFGSPIQIAQKLLDNADVLDFDQLIYENTWIHISRKAAIGSKQRRNVLTLMPDGSYQSGIIAK